MAQSLVLSCLLHSPIVDMNYVNICFIGVICKLWLGCKMVLSNIDES